MKKGFGELFSDSFEEYKKKFIYFLKSFFYLQVIPALILGAIALILIIVLSLSGAFSFDVLNAEVIEQGSVSLENFISLPLLIILIIVFVILFLILFYFYLISSISYIYISFINTKKEIKFKTIFDESKRYFWKYFGLIIVMSILLVLLFLLLIIPGVIFLVYWIFSTFILIREDTGIWGSMKRSKLIVKGKWWTVFGYSLLLLLLTCLSSLVTFIPIIGWLAYSLFVPPFVVIFFKNFYLDLRKGKSK